MDVHIFFVMFLTSSRKKRDDIFYSIRNGKKYTWKDDIVFVFSTLSVVEQSPPPLFDGWMEGRSNII